MRRPSRYRRPGWIVTSVAIVMMASCGGARVPAEAAVGPEPDETVQEDEPRSLALLGGLVVPEAGAAPVRDGIVLVRGNTIEAVGPADSVTIPEGARRLDCRGATVLPAFWNSHVHLGGVAARPTALEDARLDAIFREAFLRWGFVYAVEAYASSLANTRTIQHRISSGDVVGPRVFTTGEGFAPADAPPAYLVLPTTELPPVGRGFPLARAQTEARVMQRLDEGVDALKLMTGSITAQGIVVMPAELVAEATRVAHARATPVLAHPSNGSGARVAVEGGVDILAHAFPHVGWDEDLIPLMIERNVALIPTLQVWKEREVPLDIAIEQLRQFVEAGGEVLFGNDLRSPADLPPTREYRYMLRAGMSFHELLASLTTAPARRFGMSEETGRLRVGMNADVVVVNGDATSDPAALGSVRYTLRGGQVVFRGSDRASIPDDLDEEVFSRPFTMRTPTVSPTDFDKAPIPYRQLDLEAYVGTYRIDDGEEVTVSIHDGALRVTPSREDVNHLVPLGDHVFAQGLYRDGELVRIYWPANRFVFEMEGDRAVAYELRSETTRFERGVRIR